MNWKKFFNVPAVIVLALTLSGCFEEIVPLEVGSKAPPAALEQLNGGPLELSDHPGKGLVMTFMSSWCPCSNESIPMMKKAYDLYGKGGTGQIAFQMIGIQDPEYKFKAFVEKWELPFPAAYDDGDEIARMYSIKQPPTTIFIDKEGTVQRIFYGNIKDKEQEFYPWIEELL